MLSEYFIREHEPLFLNEGTSQFELELKKLEAIAPLVADDDRERIERDIRLYRAGIAGERRIAFELCNSHYPLVFIHDLHLEFEGTEAQIDYLVVTPCNTIVIECKNMVGDIEINRDGAFIRTFGKGVRRRREGIYSPITQNKRHVELLKAIVRSQRGIAIQFAQQFFLDDYYHSVVVLANDKSLLLGSEAPDEVRRQVIRADQLIDYIRLLDKKYARKNGRETFEQVRKRAERWLTRNVPVASDIATKYRIVRMAPGKELNNLSQSRRIPSRSNMTQAVSQSTSFSAEQPPTCPVCGAPMVIRVARRGKNKGNKFWGCSMFGKNGCRGIVQLDNED